MPIKKNFRDKPMKQNTEDKKKKDDKTINKNDNDPIKKIEKLKKLAEKGAITKKDFEKKKKELLNKI